MLEVIGELWIIFLFPGESYDIPPAIFISISLAIIA
jgi:hypothetical protein